MTDVYQMQTVVLGVWVPGRNIPGFPSVPSNLGGNGRRERTLNMLQDEKKRVQMLFLILNKAFDSNNC